MHTGHDLTIYRVQERKPAWRRKWQAEWEPYCYWAARGYTRRGAVLGARFRRAHPRLDSAYCRMRYALRWMTNAGDGWYRTVYTPTGLHRSAK